MSTTTTHPEDTTFGAADCSCRLYDDGDVENGPSLAIDVHDDCARHGRGTPWALAHGYHDDPCERAHSVRVAP